MAVGCGLRHSWVESFSWKAIRNHGTDGRLGEFVTQADPRTAKNDCISWCQSIEY
ncbi:MAG: hypothetical protein A4E49_02820 [Methanosaeta sp. PtaU1.Bin112]|nr:MAG: hypothetical protein A4E49_02820 [Methanosaeta sp. PtaU1.Bin112]